MILIGKDRFEGSISSLSQAVEKPATPLRVLPDNEELTVVVVYSIRYNNETCAERPALSEAEVWFAPDPATGRESVRTEQFHNPYLAMGNNPVVYVDPDGEFVVNLIGAGISVLTNGISNSINGQGFFDNAGKAVIMGAIGGAMSFGIGQATMGLKGLGKIGAQTLAHGHLGGIMSTANGGSYGSGFAAGGLGSLAGTGAGVLAGQVKSNALKAGITTAGGAAAGGLGAELTGGNFWDGARNGAISAGLNHGIHAGYFGKGLMMSSITGRTRHLFGPDAMSYSVEAGAQVGVGMKPIQKGVYNVLRGDKQGWYTYDGAAFSAGTPALGVEASAIELYYNGATSAVSPSTFTGTYHQWSLGIDVGIGLSGIALYSRLPDQTAVYGIGIGLSLDAVPNYIDFTYQYGATTLSRDSYHDNPMRRIFGW